MKFFIAIISLASFQLHAASNPYAEGRVEKLNWELRVNHLSSEYEPGSVCNHEGQKAGAWCDDSDTKTARKLSGVEDRLEELMNLPEIRSVTMAYFSFSSSNMKRAMCDAAKNNKINITLYIDQSNKETVQSMLDCSSRIKVVGIGRGPYMAVPDSHLFHMKIFIASTLPELAPLSELKTELSEKEFKSASTATTYVVSSSGNMSGYGTSLHFDNWLFFNGPTSENVIQSNVCTLSSLKGLNADNRDRRKEFAKRYKACRDEIETEESPDLKFYAVPHDEINPQPYDAYKSMIDRTESELLVAIHRMTSKAVWSPWVSAKKRGVNVQVIMDDDTLRTGKEYGGAAHDVKVMDVQADRGIRKAGIKTYYMETNAEGRPHLFHSKFFISDGRRLFQGAGNFSSAALNIYGLGNYEQFYEIRVPEIVNAYKDAWMEYKTLATPLKDHPVYKHRDLTYDEISDKDSE